MEMELRITLDELAEYLERRNVFKTREGLNEFLEQGLALLYDMRSSLLDAYIVERLRRDFLKELPPEVRAKALGDERYLRWCFTQSLREVKASRTELVFKYEPVREYKVLLRARTRVL
ncbi:MAG: hypothetical protein OD814_001079 [Candidatus Alkanophagales archaeon MCA70_species_1]|nr:hypothetical protein [Candidatus Alkanophaga volatiphilum]